MGPSLQCRLLNFLLPYRGFKKSMREWDEDRWRKEQLASVKKIDPGSFFKKYDWEEKSFKSLTFVTVRSPLKKKDGMVVYYFAGGAFCSYPSAMHYNFGLSLLEMVPDLTMVFVHYRLSPQGSHIDFYPSFIKFYKETLEEIDAGRICLMGDSSGSAQAVALAQQFKKEGLPVPKDLIIFSSVLDLGLDHPKILELEKYDPILHPRCLKYSFIWWANGTSFQDPLVSPIYGSWEGIGRVMLIVGTRELFWSDALRVKDKVAEYIEYDGLPHDFPLVGFLPETREVKARIARRLMA